jgi:hypothetical protein
MLPQWPTGLFAGGAYIGLYVCAPRTRAHLRYRVLFAECFGFLTVMKGADTKCDVSANREGKSSAGPVVRPCGSSSGADLFCATP